MNMLKKGLTLVELLVAAGILIIICSMLFLSFTNCIILNESSRNRTIVVTHAEHVLEEIKNSDFSSLFQDINDGNWDWDDVRIEQEFDPANNSDRVPLRGEFITTTVNDIGTSAPLLDVVVNITWQHRRSGEETTSIILETLITEP